ncbi:MJ0042-type zinc finger domain-containing protein [Beijerinckia sp. L45]|uniref:MJ0042-type zinc finger domain-containing protein n=1 Tax=Beijerinckia sp. L45 TaxID=1641855 RepID=UPI00131D806D|nr:MJ0042-type zinc finger domain-containing protein [Beijerinckia sp. L45]
MQIDCPTCARSYHVALHALGTSGRTVVCPACATRWHVAAPDDDRHPIAASSRGVIRAQTDDRLSRLAIARPTANRRKSGALRPVAVSLALACLSMLVIGKRTAIVMAAPRTAALYAAVGLPVNIRGLEIGGLKTTRLDDPTQRVEISGDIRNLVDARTPVPRLTFDIRDIHGATLATWTDNAPKRMLADNESVAFTTQSPVLPDGTKDVVARFDANADHDTLLIHKAR